MGARGIIFAKPNREPFSGKEIVVLGKPERKRASRDD